MGNLTNAFFGNHSANLVGNFSYLGFAHGTADLNRNLLNDFFRNHATDCVWHPRDDRLGNHAANRHRTDLTNNLWLVGRAGNLAFNDVRAPDSLAGIETWHACHAQLRTARATDELRTAGPRMIDLLRNPLTTVLSFRAICRNGTHDGVTSFLIDHFSLLSHDRLTTFTLERFGDGSLNAASDFAGCVFKHLSLSCVRLIAVKRFGDGTHHGVTFFTIGSLVDLTGDLILLFAIGNFVHDPVMCFLHIIENGFVHCSADGVRLRFLNRLINRALTHLPLDALSGVAAILLTCIHRTAPVTRGSAVPPCRNSSR